MMCTVTEGSLLSAVRLCVFVKETVAVIAEVTYYDVRYDVDSSYLCTNAASLDR